MKKGFTIVELIISISIVLIVGISTTFFIFNNKSNKELENITKEILEAANLYANKEVDEKGKIYLNEVRSEKKGIKIPLDNLVSKGYIKEEIKNEVMKLSNKGNDYNYYVMLLNSNKDYCNGEVFSLASWIDSDKDKDIYLCNNNSGVNIEDNFVEGYDIRHAIAGISKEQFINYDIENNDCAQMPGNKSCCILQNHSGIKERTYYDLEKETIGDVYEEVKGCRCEGYTEDGEYIGSHSFYTAIPKYSGLYSNVEDGMSETFDYYFFGEVNNNYLKIGDTLFIIVGFEGNMPLIYVMPNDPIDQQIYFSSVEFNFYSSINNFKEAINEGIINYKKDHFAVTGDPYLDNALYYDVSSRYLLMNDYLYDLIHHPDYLYSINYISSYLPDIFNDDSYANRTISALYPMYIINVEKLIFDGIGTMYAPYTFTEVYFE